MTDFIAETTSRSQDLIKAPEPKSVKSEGVEVEKSEKHRLQLLDIANKSLSDGTATAAIPQMVEVINAAGWKDVLIKREVFGGKWVGKYNAIEGTIKVAAKDLTDERIVYELYHEFSFGELTKIASSLDSPEERRRFVDERIDRRVQDDLEVIKNIKDDSLRRDLTNEREALANFALKNDKLRSQTIEGVIIHPYIPQRIQ